MNGTMLSQIDGMPICIKENYCTLEGYTTDCSKALDTYKSPIESTVTRHLAEAGALFVGKVNMDEFAMGSANSFTYKGQCYNPWGTPEHPLVPGGSSGGSASSVASGMCYAALGSDTGGSIRQVRCAPALDRVARRLLRHRRLQAHLRLRLQVRRRLPRLLPGHARRARQRRDVCFPSPLQRVATSPWCTMS